MGPPIGERRPEADGVVIDDWLGTSWQEVDPATQAMIDGVLGSDEPDAGALHAIDWELAPFWCRSCRRSYCRDHWQRMVIMDEGFYDYSDGICPAGHRQMIDD